jgi:hypothetical protein
MKIQWFQKLASMDLPGPTWSNLKTRVNPWGAI